jgi:lysophospholipase L1-like esterase
MDERTQTSGAARALLLVGAVLVAAVLLEVGARLVLRARAPEGSPIQLGWEPDPQRSKLRDQLYRPDPDLFFRLRPDVRIERSTNPRIFDVRTNARGLRSPAVTVPKPPGTLRVLAVGDSCTFGSGAGQSDTWPAQLARRLGADRPERPVEVVNAGVPGFSSWQVIRYLEIEGWGLEPDVVVIASGINDAHPANAGDKRPFGESRWLSDREYAAVLRDEGALGITRLLRRAGILPLGSGSAGHGDGVKRRVPLDEYEAGLRRFASEARDRGVTPVIVAWPLQSQVGPGDAAPDPALEDVARVYARYQAAAEAAARSGDAVFVPLIGRMDGRTDLFVDPVHMNAEGYGRVADAVADALESAGV